MIAEKTYLIPTNINEAIKMAKANLGSFKYLAGGTDIMVNRFQGNEDTPCLIDITKIDELKESPKKAITCELEHWKSWKN